MLYNIDAEKNLLGALIKNPLMLSEIITIIKPENFYFQKHQYIYKAILELFNENKPIDVISVSENLRFNEKLDACDGRPYINDLAFDVISTANIGYYAKIVDAYFKRRQIIRIADQIKETAEKVEDKDDVINTVQDLFLQVTTNNVINKDALFKDFIIDVYNNIEDRFVNKNKISGLNTGFHDLNDYTGGFQKSDLIILAARPSMGKTALALNIAENIALDNKLPVAVFTLEMSKEQIGQRLLTSNSGISSLKVRNGDLNDADFTKIHESMGKYADCPLYIYDTPGATVTEIRAECKKIKMNEGLGIVIIDYLQLMGGTKNNENRTNEVAGISRGLKNLARELDCPVLALSQLSRKVEERSCKKPMLSDLRDSGSIEQDADIVIFIYRDEYYDENSEKKGKAEIIVAKQRNGPVGSFELLFQQNITKFKNLAVFDK